MKFIENIFSVKNYKQNYKQICLFGLKIRFHRNFKPNTNYNHLPVQNNKITFRNHTGSYTCNSKYITEEILKQNLPYDLVWIVNKNILKYIKDFPQNIRLVMEDTQDANKEYATAKIWVETDRRDIRNSHLLKREEQTYIQTFHGAFGFKKCGGDRKDRNIKDWLYYKIDAEQTDYLISNSSQATNFFKTAFWNCGKILEYGQPRNDIFFKDSSKIKEKVYKYFNVQEGKKIVLYAPTFRENKDFSCYNLNFEKLREALSKKFGEKFVIMLRLHPRLISLKDKYNNDFKDIIDATEYGDMQELLVTSDILITDYSSCICDYMLSRKPAFIYAADVKKYDNERGLYYPLSSTPFPVAENNDEMVKNIEDFNYEKYKIALEKFISEKGCIDDGRASERVVELIKQIISNCENDKK